MPSPKPAAAKAPATLASAERRFAIVLQSVPDAAL